MRFDDTTEESILAAIGAPRPWLHVCLVERNARIILLSKTETPKAIVRIIGGISLRRVHTIIQEFRVKHSGDSGARTRCKNE